MLLVRALITFVLAMGTATFSYAQTRDPWPQDTTRSYEPISMNAAVEYGDLRLSQTFASFSRLKGHMDLHYETTLGEDAERIIAEPTETFRVYRILNAKEFARQNKQPHFFCGSAEWLGVAKISSSTVLIAFFDLQIYRQEDFRRSGTCSESAYDLRP